MAYQKILARIELEKQNKKLDFFNSVPVFGSLNRRLLQKMTYNSSKVKFKYGQIVYRVGEESEFFYVVYRGEF